MLVFVACDKKVVWGVLGKGAAYLSTVGGCALSTTEEIMWLETLTSLRRRTSVTSRVRRGKLLPKLGRRSDGNAVSGNSTRGGFEQSTGSLWRTISAYMMIKAVVVLSAGESHGVGCAWTIVTEPLKYVGSFVACATSPSDT